MIMIVFSFSVNVHWLFQLFWGGGNSLFPPPPVLCINPDKAAELTSQCGTLNLIFFLGGGGGEGGGGVTMGQCTRVL